MSTIDWGRAPDWAIGHALYAFGGEISEVWVGESHYQRLDQAKSFPYGGGVGDTRHNPRRSEFRYEQLRPAPWAGEGLPTVGADVEVRYAIEEFSVWHKATCVAIGQAPEGEQICVTRSETGVVAVYRTGEHIRPYRTAEQIAADERLHEIRNALTTIKAGQQQFPNDLVRGNITLSVVEAMIDAGYRKQVKP